LNRIDIKNLIKMASQNSIQSSPRGSQQSSPRGSQADRQEESFESEQSVADMNVEAVGWEVAHHMLTTFDPNKDKYISNMIQVKQII
jgi:hypothetical protein